MERKTEYSEAEKLDSAAKRKKDKSKNKRRFSDEQISLLESIFEADSKLEPRRKVQLARELGLQPRQVAIWFQNKRARWKSKQIEQDFRTLKADYDRLASRFESLNEEKQSLLMQLQKLNDLVGKPQPQDGNLDSQGLDTNCETDQVRPSNLQGESEQRGVMDSKKNNTGNDAGDYGDVEVEGPELLTMGHVNASVPDISPQDWTRFDSGVLFDPSRITSQWLNFWT